MLKDDPHFICFSLGKGEVYQVSLHSGKLRDWFFYWHIHPNKNHEEVLQHGLMKGEGHAFSSQENWVIFSALLLMCFTVPGK